MNPSKWIRQIHRWMSIAFTLVAGTIFAAQGLGKEPAESIYFLPLAPLSVLLLTGLYMFAQPYVAAWCRGRPAAGRGGTRT